MLLYTLDNKASQDLAASTIGKNLAHCHADGVCVEATEHGFHEERLTLFGCVSLSGADGPLLCASAHKNRLKLGRLDGLEGLETAYAKNIPSAGAHIRGLGDFTNVSDAQCFENAKVSALIIGFQAGNLTVFEAVESAVGVTNCKPETEEYGLWAQYLQFDNMT